MIIKLHKRFVQIMYFVAKNKTFNKRDALNKSFNQYSLLRSIAGHRPQTNCTLLGIKNSLKKTRGLKPNSVLLTPFLVISQNMYCKFIVQSSTEITCI